jgi:hypothetical protein
MLERCLVVLQNLSGTERTMGEAHPERLSFITSRNDGSNSPVEIGHHLTRRQPQHIKSLRRQIGIALPIPLWPITAIMRFAVNLDCQPPLQAGEIQRNLAQWMLPPELISPRPLAQFAPDQHFMKVARLPLVSGQLSRAGGGGEHGVSLHCDCLSGLLRKPVSPCRKDV